MPGQVRSGSAIVVLGGGCGLDSVLRALRGLDGGPTVIVSTTYEIEGGGDPRDRLTGAGVADLRRSLEALSGEDGALLRAMRRQLTVERLGRHRLGDLALASAAMALGDYAQASAWLGQQLGIDGAVLPATIEPVRWNIDVLSRAAVIKSLTGVGPVVRQLQFVGDRIRSPEVAIDAVRRARWVLLAPGALYGCVLAAAAVPDLAAALTGTSARVVWIANLEPDRNDAANMSAIDHLLVLRRHGVRVDVVLHDGSAMLKFDPTELAVHGVESVSRRLGTGANPPRHDPDRLRSALAALIGSKRAGTDRGRPRQ